MSSAFFDPDATVHCSMETYYAVKEVENLTDDGPVWAATDILRLMGCQKLRLTDPNPTNGNGLLQQVRFALRNSGFEDTRRMDGDLTLTYEHMSAVTPLIRRENRSKINEVVEAMRRRTSEGVKIPHLTIAPVPPEDHPDEDRPAVPSAPAVGVVDVFDIPEGTPAHENTHPVSELFYVDEVAGVQFERVFHLGKMWVSAAPLCKAVKSSGPAAMLRKLRRTALLSDATFTKFTVCANDQYKSPYWCDETTAEVIVSNFGGENTAHLRAVLARGFAAPNPAPVAVADDTANDDASAALDLFSDALAEVTDDLTSRIDALAKRVEEGLTPPSDEVPEGVRRYLSGQLRTFREELSNEEESLVAKRVNDAVSDKIKGLSINMAAKIENRLAIQGSNHLQRVREELPALVSKASSEHIRKQVTAMMRAQLGTTTEEVVKASMSEFQLSTMSQVESRFAEMREQVMQEARDERAAFMGTVKTVLVDVLGADLAEEVTDAITRAQLTGAELRDRIRELAKTDHERELLLVLSKHGAPMVETDIPTKLKAKSRKVMHTTLHGLEQRGVIYRDSSKRWVFQAV